MDSWLKQEALKNPDIKRLAHEEHTSGNKSTHLPLCSARSRAHINLVSIFVGKLRERAERHSPGCRETWAGWPQILFTGSQDPPHSCPAV